MKKSILSLLGVMMVLGTFFTSCKKDEGTKPAPTIDFVPTATTVEVAKDSSYIISVKYHADQKFKSIVITKTEGASSSTYKNMTTGFQSETDHTEQYTLPV